MALFWAVWLIILHSLQQLIGFFVLYSQTQHKDFQWNLICHVIPQFGHLLAVGLSFLKTRI